MCCVSKHEIEKVVGGMFGVVPQGQETRAGPFNTVKEVGFGKEQQWTRTRLGPRNLSSFQWSSIPAERKILRYLSMRSKRVSTSFGPMNNNRSMRNQSVGVEGPEGSRDCIGFDLDLDRRTRKITNQTTHARPKAPKRPNKPPTV